MLLQITKGKRAGHLLFYHAEHSINAARRKHMVHIGNLF
jgi:hypothetical protein